MTHHAVATTLHGLRKAARRSPLAIVALIVLAAAGGPALAVNLQVKVLKACPDCRLPAAEACTSVHRHWDRAATWTPETAVRIHAVSIPEQTEVAIYTDIEVSTAAEMYLPEGHIFRAKYAGPGILRNPPCDVSFAGSNITATQIVFPTGTWIEVPAGTPIYVHLDVINWTPYEIHPMTQDVYIYYSEAAPVDGSDGG
jgi:hypothetical protein